MSDPEREGMMWQSIKNSEQASVFIERLFRLAEPGVVFGEPVSKGDYTVITASEISVGGGFGFGSGGSFTPESAALQAAGSHDVPGFGGGGGGGGGGAGRPVAAIVISSEGVRIEPIIDATKVALAFLALAGSVTVLLAKAAKRRK